MSGNRRLFITIFLSAGLLALLLMASSVSKLELKGGTLFDRATIDELSLLLAQFAEYRGLLLVCAAALPFIFLIASFLQQSRYQRLPEARRNNMLVVVLQLILLMLAFMVLRRKIQENENNPLNPAQLQVPESIIGNGPERIPVDVPQIVAFMVGFTLLSLAALLVIYGMRKRQKKTSSFKVIQQEALDAIDEIDQGVDLRDVIMHCYYQMTLTVERQRGIRRAQGMTPREFEGHLVRLGLPEEPVFQLTRLFEDVRYGSKTAGRESEELARICLGAIASAGKGAG